MGKLWMQACANIRKTKSVSITLAALFLISALLINSGLLVTINYGSFFNDLKQELNAADAYLYIPDDLYNDDVKEYIDNNEHIKNTQKNDILVLGSEIYYKNKEKSFTIAFNNMEVERNISKWKFVGKHLPPDDMSVYVPDLFKAVGGYDLNDKITLKYRDKVTNENKELVFTVKGFTEDIFFSSTDTGIISFYLTEDTYSNVGDILSDSENKSHIVFANLDDVASTSKIENGIRDVLGVDSSSVMAGDTSKMIFSIDIKLVELSRCMMATFISIMMVLFAAVIVVVCLLVVRFRIINSLEDDIMKIGSLKSIGYTNRQIITTIIMQFVTIAGLGSILGIIASYPLLPSISTMFEQQSGLKWEQGFDGIISLITLFSILFIVLIVVLLVARKVKKLTPVLALRGEMTGKKYSKNHLPLEETKGNLSVLLAFKSILQNIKQNIMIIVILISVVFAGAYGVIMYYNTSVDTKAFSEIPGFEITNAIAVLNTEKDHTDALETIKNMEKVEKIQYVDEVKFKVEDIDASCTLMDAFDKRETNLVYEGHYPKNSGEITLAGILAERIHKNIGDTVTIKVGEKTQTFKVTGLSNGSSMGGINTSLLVSDYLKLNPDFKQQLLYIYLEKGTIAADFIEELESTLSKDVLISTSNFDKLMAEGMESYQNVVNAMGVAMFIITLFVITLVLYFVISSTIVRRKRELGIKKAIGFTTIQLMNQISLSFIVPILIGTVIGSYLGAVGTNPMMSATMKGAGVMKTSFIVDPVWIVIFSIAILVFSYLLSLFISWRIRKISAYALVTE